MSIQHSQTESSWIQIRLWLVVGAAVIGSFFTGKLVRADELDMPVESLFVFDQIDPQSQPHTPEEIGLPTPSQQLLAILPQKQKIQRTLKKQKRQKHKSRILTKSAPTLLLNQSGQAPFKLNLSIRISKSKSEVVRRSMLWPLVQPRGPISLSEPEA